MEHIINKLDQMGNENNENDWKTWTLDERKKILEIYLIISKKESQLFNLIYRYHGCDTWEDIFRDYDMTYLQDKAAGVEVAIEGINERIEKE
jgi:hypothetical protein